LYLLLPARLLPARPPPFPYTTLFRSFLITTLIVTLVSGLGVWLFSSPNSLTVGASGLVFGYFGYTVLRGIIERKTIDIVIMICRSEEHTSELQSRFDLVCRLLLEKKK